jgi:hypothetical protein
MMDRRELHDLLVGQGIDPNTFDVTGSDPAPFPGDIYVLRHFPSPIVARPDYWATYYSERGGNHRQKKFASESEACRHFLAWIVAEQRACSNEGALG